jgi:hypothetical protein
MGELLLKLVPVVTSPSQRGIRGTRMSIMLEQLLDSFDALPEPEKHQAAIEILLRVRTLNKGDVPDLALLEAADELFCALDAEEGGNAKR